MQKILGDLFEFPFYAEVWGTTSDWVMVLVTFITAVYLIKTFQSQKEVQKLQLKSTIIENEIFRIKNEPFLNDSDHKVEVRKVNDFVEFTLQVNMIFSHDAIKLSSETYHSNSKEIYSKILIVNSDYIRKSENFYFVMNIKINKNDLDKYESRGDVTFYFEDIIGNKYSKKYFYVLGYSDVMFNSIGQIRVLDN